MIFDSWFYDVLSDWEWLVRDGWTPSIVQIDGKPRCQWELNGGRILCG